MFNQRALMHKTYSVGELFLLLDGQHILLYVSVTFQQSSALYMPSDCRRKVLQFFYIQMF